MLTRLIKEVVMQDNKVKGLSVKVASKIPEGQYKSRFELKSKKDIENENMIKEDTDYDMSIHSNPDAAAWAKLFKRTVEEQKWTIEDINESLMLGWFANAMMAMHDHVLSEKEKQADWNGEGLPPVGAKVISSGGAEVFYVGLNSKGEYVFELLDNGGLTVFSSLKGFSPIKSERDKWVDEAAARMGTFKGSECEWYLAAVYDSLVNGYLEMPKLANK